jgi:hypothetical protein
MALSKHRQLARSRRCSKPDQIHEHDDFLLLEEMEIENASPPGQR